MQHTRDPADVVIEAIQVKASREIFEIMRRYPGEDPESMECFFKVSASTISYLQMLQPTPHGKLDPYVIDGLKRRGIPVEMDHAAPNDPLCITLQKRKSDAALKRNRSIRGNQIKFLVADELER